MQNNFENRMEQLNLTNMAMQQMITLGNEVREMSQAVIANNTYMMGTVQAEIARSERERRKRRKKELQSFVSVANGHFGLIKVFDDGSKEITDLALNFVPDFAICIFEMQGAGESGKYFGICSQKQDFWIIGETEKVSGKWLWKAFIKNGVKFNSQIPQRKVQNALYEFFMPKIVVAEKRQIPALSGWFEKEFWSAETFLFEKNQGFQNIPIRKKSFQDYSGNPLCSEKYFRKIREISDWRNRIWMMLYPIGGMINSLLWEAGIKPAKYLNFVVLADIPVRRLYSYLSVFNRNRPIGKIVCPDDILEIKDEVVILDSCSDFGESRYKKEQKIRMFQSIADGIINGNFFTGDGFVISSPVAMFSDRITRRKYGINVFVDLDFFRTENKGNRTVETEDSVGMVLYYAVQYVEKNFDKIKNFLDMGKEADSETAWLCFTFKIFEEFWNSYGVDLKVMAGLPETIDFHELLLDNLYFEDDLLQDFVKIVRKEIRNWQVVPKNQGKGNGNEILYAEENVWMPVNVLNQIFSQYGILEQRYQFLEKLREEGYLITDQQGMSRKVQVEGKRYEAYQFKLSLFHIPGAVNIIELGQEVKNAER